MRKILMWAVAIAIVISACRTSTSVEETPKKYEENWESLNTVNPEAQWFKDAKFGIYTHWGPVSGAFIDMPEGLHLRGWHGRFMYEPGSPNFKHQVKVFGDPKEYSYIDHIKNFKPTGFDAKEWAELFKISGAKFAGPVAMHHDNFAMWDSKATRWNSVNYGGIDVSAELKREIEARGMKFMGSFHHAYTWKYFAPAHAYADIAEEDYDLYTEPHDFDDDKVTERFMVEWWAKLKEYIDVYQPDLIWFDWWLENLPENYRKKFLAYYYNKAEEWGKEVSICFKETTFPEEVALRDYERGRPNQPKAQAWLTDTSPGAWFYRSNAKFVTPNELVDILVDIVAKNGNMLLNVPPNPDGTIPEEMKHLLKEMGAWLKVNGDAIYGTRVWTVFGEGPTRIPSGGHKIEKKKIVYTENDIRFTKKSDTEFYAIMMNKAVDKVVIKTLSTMLGVLNANIEHISLLGSDEELKWERTEEGLVIDAPSTYPSEYAHAFKIELEGYKEKAIDGTDLE